MEGLAAAGLGIIFNYVLAIAIVFQLMMTGIYVNKGRPWVALGVWLSYPTGFVLILGIVTLGIVV